MMSPIRRDLSVLTSLSFLKLVLGIPYRLESVRSYCFFNQLSRICSGALEHPWSIPYIQLMSICFTHGHRDKDEIDNTARLNRPTPFISYDEPHKKGSVGFNKLVFSQACIRDPVQAWKCEELLFFQDIFVLSCRFTRLIENWSFQHNVLDLILLYYFFIAWTSLAMLQSSSVSATASVKTPVAPFTNMV